MSECFGQGEQLLEQEKTLVEGAGSVGFAALRNRKIEGVAGKSVAVVVSGGNINLNVFSTILERGEAKDGRLTHLKVVLPDKPGTVVELSAVLPVTALTSCKSFTNAPFHKLTSAKSKSPLPWKPRGTNTRKKSSGPYPRKDSIRARLKPAEKTA